ncbi:MAG: hypothetical protein PHQ93_09500 [Sulfurimonas sp.]|uniref:hypothetical protein n=1 Tax=Sulfurimonas sp. TaxID=2022749 RepID=UPI002638945E|nr:hypothetical protein [Sulfurimonas sp.]MDD5401408.1 hypothetical protein [Sulfurimonas sp.]
MKSFFIALTIMLPLLASATQIQNKELSPQAIKDQGKEITKLAAEEISKSLPQTVDKYTKLIDAQADNTTLVYIYEINTAPKSDETVKKEDHSRMKKAVTEGTCKTSKRFLEANISIRYIYKSALTKAELFRFDISQESCPKL